jgi:hypothetical protein
MDKTNNLPKSWGEYKKLNPKNKAINARGDYISEYIPALVALHKLLLLRDAWGGGRWKRNKYEYPICISVMFGRIPEDKAVYTLSFPNVELRNEFQKTFYDLINEAKILL